MVYWIHSFSVQVTVRALWVVVIITDGSQGRKGSIVLFNIVLGTNACSIEYITDKRRTNLALTRARSPAEPAFCRLESLDFPISKRKATVKCFWPYSASVESRSVYMLNAESRSIHGLNAEYVTGISLLMARNLKVSRHHAENTAKNALTVKNMITQRNKETFLEIRNNRLFFIYDRICGRWLKRLHHIMNGIPNLL